MTVLRVQFLGETHPKKVEQSFISVAHLLLSSVQRLLEPLGEDPSSSLEVRTHFILCHVLKCSVKHKQPASRLLPLEKLPSRSLKCGFNSRRWRWSNKTENRRCQPPGIKLFTSSSPHQEEEEEEEALVETCRRNY